MARPSNGKPFDSSPLDRETVDRLVVEHLPAALRLALRLTGAPHTAEDVVQDALCRVLRQWQNYRGEAAFGTWLFRIVINVDRDRRRRQRDVSPMPAEPSQEQLARLEDFWREQSKATKPEGKPRHRRARPAIYWMAALATTILVAVVTSLCLWRSEPTLEVVATQEPVKAEPTLPANPQHKQSNVIVAAESPQKKDTLSAGRPPTSYERILFIAATRKSVAARQSAVAAKIDKANLQIVLNTENTENINSEVALRSYLLLVRNDTLSAEALAAADVVSGPLLQRLLGLLKDDDEGTRLSAAMVLGHANGPEVSAALIKLVTTENDRQSSPAV